MNLNALPRSGTMLLGLLMASPGFAGSFSTSGSSGSGAYSQNFSYSHREDPGPGDGTESRASQIYSASYTFTRTEVGSTSGADTRTYNLTHSLSGGIGFIEAWRYGGRVRYTGTPAEYLSSFGASFYGAWDFNEDADEEESPKGFSRPWGLRADVGFSEYSLTVNGVRPVRRPGGRGTQTKTSNLRIGQASLEGTAWIDATSWMSLRLSHTRYFYTRDVAGFMAVLDDPRAIATGAAQFGSTLAGFSSRGWDAGIDFTAPAKIFLSIGGSWYTSASSGVLTRGYSAELGKSFGGFTPGISWDRYVSNGDFQDLFGFSLSFNI